MKTRYSWKSFLAVQLVVVAAGGLALFLADANAKVMIRQEIPGGEAFVPVAIPRSMPLYISRPYNRPDLVSDEDLAAVLKQIQPRFDQKEMKPNFIEHALRTWGVDATFQNPKCVSGQAMLEFLTDNASFVESWGKEIAPLLQERPKGVGIHWGPDTGASYHHDHLLACVTEAGAPLNTPVYGPTRRRDTLYDVIQESLRDFRLDERETEWTAMAFGLWIPPTSTWIGSGGRQYSFDLLVDRLLRGEKAEGVCGGTHRVYSLMLLVRLDDEFNILSDAARESAYGYLKQVRDTIILSQFEDGHWTAAWPEGKAALTKQDNEPMYKSVIATGHHLEWMSIAPPDLLIPEDRIKKAMDWVINNTKSQKQSDIKTMFTFYSHVGAALCNWRQVRPADFWREWERSHPYDPSEEVVEAAPVEKTPAPAAH
ncbi:hypothetical protein [Planctomicrobium piriforme]|uniref:Uncharacterized protein n=1 Tax=Planctomicrobium piriforme TaxID=1576369 RepID=A0A1I3BC42_9PLAN|nr:hypothetical protein [Planctomicrobium piriforme]SFH59281.1 hypothetical protein SAMN05421753_101340 [Planctomicrobium piriforme]